MARRLLLVVLLARFAACADAADDAYNRGLTFKRAGDSAAAIREFSEAVRQRPEWSLAHYALGAAYFDSGDTTHGQIELRRAIELDPKNAAARRYLGGILLRGNSIPEAVEQFE